MIRVAIIDDHFVVRFGIKAIVGMEKDMILAGEAEEAADVISFIRRFRPDIILLDIKMPGVDGLEALKKILSAEPQSKVIMLTTSDADNDIYTALSLGAKGYLLKDRDAKTIVDAIRAVASGGKFIPAAIRESFELRHMTPDLTPREAEVLRLVADGLSNEKISLLLGIGYTTTKFHVKNLLQKLNAHDRTELAAEARRRGFVK